MRAIRPLFAAAVVCFGCASTDENDRPDADSDTDTDTDSDCAGEDTRGQCEDPIDVRAEGESDAEGLYFDGTTVGRCDHASSTCTPASDGDVAFSYTLDTDADLLVWTVEGFSEFRAVVYARSVCDSGDSEIACGVDTADGT